MTKVLGREELLSGDNLRRELYKIPGTDTAVWMREMTTDHMLQFRRITERFKSEGVKQTTPEQDVEIMTAVISFSVCDENGNLLFDTPEEAKGLSLNNFNMLMDLGNKALEISKVRIGENGPTSSEATDTLPNAPATSLSGNLPRNSRKRVRKS